jgi:hypothetical protein
MGEETIWTFDDPACLEEWKTVDDVVMGGRSASDLDWMTTDEKEGAPTAGAIRFGGEVSLENNGGFCSARLVEGERGVPGLQRLQVVARGDGSRYKCTLRTADRPSSSSWRLPFETEADRWRVYELPLEGFELWRRGTLLAADERPEPEAITSFGLLISDGQEGEFRIELGEVRGALGHDG